MSRATGKVTSGHSLRLTYCSVTFHVVRQSITELEGPACQVVRSLGRYLPWTGTFAGLPRPPPPFS